MIAFLCSYAILFFSQYKIQEGTAILQGDETYESQKKFYLENTVGNKIFLIGSSQILALNTTYIDGYLSLHNEHFQIYNLASNSDHPTERLKTINLIIGSKPSIIFYGIAPRDFQKVLPLSSLSKPISILPDPQEMVSKSLSMFMNYVNLDSSILESPKLIILQDFKKMTREKTTETQWIPYPDTFLAIAKNSTEIMSNEEIKSRLPFTTPVTTIETDYNEDEIALEKMITKLHNNKIKIVIFVVPESRPYLNEMPESYKESFNSIVNHISKLQGIKIYRLDERYADLNVWTDPIHIAINDNTTEYSEDISKIILGEIH